ncbi:MAG TPA: hypothetical protein VGD55_14005 [Acidothermaceae bacterium]
MIAAPPFVVGALNATDAVVSPAVAATPVGADGDVLGVTALLGADATPVPMPFIAVTVKVYAVPLVSPDTVIGELVPVAVKFPGADVTVYPLIGDPLAFGATNDTAALATPAVALTPVGALGALGELVPDAAVTEQSSYTSDPFALVSFVE